MCKKYGRLLTIKIKKCYLIRKNSVIENETSSSQLTGNAKQSVCGMQLETVPLGGKEERNEVMR